MTDPYLDFLAGKRVAARPEGLDDVPALAPAMFPHQRDVTEFLLRAGRGAAFLDTGLGKTLIALEWCRVVAEATGRPALMLAPLAVAQQHVREAARHGLEARVVRCREQLGPGINIANYEMLHHFRAADLGGLALDESSIIKSFTGATTRALIAFGRDLRFRLAATATPAPNDHMELGQHADFLGVMAREEMLPMFFIHDAGDTTKWRLKKHAVKPFWSWVASWARAIALPSDLGYSDEGFALPPLNLHRHMVRADVGIETGGMLFRMPDTSATAIHREKRLTADARAAVIAGLVAGDASEPWIVWCDTDYEADAFRAVLPEAVEVRGSMPVERKEAGLVGFADGSVRVLVTKPSIAGFGLNWQHCARMAFLGLSFSYESFYQAVRRCWRFGQRRPVEVHVAMADTERAIWEVVNRKAGDHDAMKNEMRAAMRRAHERRDVKVDYQPAAPAALPSWLPA